MRRGTQWSTPGPKGQNTLEGLAPGAYRLEVGAPGYLGRTMMLEVQPGELLALFDLELSHHSTTDSAVSLRGIVYEDTQRLGGTVVEVKSVPTISSWSL